MKDKSPHIDLGKKAVPARRAPAGHGDIEALEHPSLSGNLALVHEVEALSLRVETDLIRLPDETLRATFAAIVRPSLDRAFDAKTRLDRSEPETAAAVQREFDRFARAILAAVSAKLCVSGSDRPRAMLYAIALAEELRRLPLGPEVERALRGSIHAHTGELYSGLGDGWEAADPTACWFTPSSIADPDASLIIDLHRLTDVFYTRCAFDQVPVLVPRSAMARWVHDGGEEEEFDPNWVHDESHTNTQAIEQLRHRRDRSIRELEGAFRTEESKLRSAVELRLRQFDAEALEETNQHSTPQGDAEFESQLRESRRQIETELSALADRYNSRLVAARKRAGRIVGVPFYALEVPALSIGAGVGWAAATAGQMPLRYVIPAGAALGLIGALAFRRSRKRRVIDIENRFRAEVATIRAIGEARSEEMRADRDSEPQRIRDRIACERREIEMEPSDLIEELRRALEDDVEAIRALTAAEITALEDASRLATKVRKLNEADRHPMVLLGLENGFQHGEVPSKAMIRVMHDHKFGQYLNRLSAKSRTELMREKHRLPMEQFDALMERLIS